MEKQIYEGPWKRQHLEGMKMVLSYIAPGMTAEGKQVEIYHSGGVTIKKIVEWENTSFSPQRASNPTEQKATITLFAEDAHALGEVERKVLELIPRGE